MFAYAHHFTGAVMALFAAIHISAHQWACKGQVSAPKFHQGNSIGVFPVMLWGAYDRYWSICCCIEILLKQ